LTRRQRSTTRKDAERTRTRTVGGGRGPARGKDAKGEEPVTVVNGLLAWCKGELRGFLVKLGEQLKGVGPTSKTCPKKEAISENGGDVETRPVRRRITKKALGTKKLGKVGVMSGILASHFFENQLQLKAKEARPKMVGKTMGPVLLYEKKGAGNEKRTGEAMAPVRYCKGIAEPESIVFKNPTLRGEAEQGKARTGCHASRNVFHGT